jgi:transcriptional regulator with XRE-family HTH domain
METFGHILASERRERQLGLKDIAEQIIKADGHHISVQYLDNLEKDLRNPSLELIPEFARVFQLPVDLLYCALCLFPPDLLEVVETRDQLLSALQIFRQAILSRKGQKQNDRIQVRYEIVSTPRHLLKSNSLLRNTGVRSPDEQIESFPITKGQSASDILREARYQMLLSKKSATDE